MPVLSPPLPRVASPKRGILPERGAPSPAWAKAHGYLLLLGIMSGCWLVGEIFAWQGFLESPLLHVIHGVRYASFYFVMMFACFTLLHLGARPPQSEWRALCVAGPAAALGCLLPAARPVPAKDNALCR